MKPFVLLLFSTFLIVSCKKKDKITFKTYEYKTEKCSDCSQVSIKYPKVDEESNLAFVINTSIKEEVISFLTYDDEIEVTTIEEGVAAFKKGHENIQKLHPDESTPWSFNANGNVAYEDMNVITIALEVHSFTGGAHGYSSKTFLNFDKKTGLEIENEELFNNLDTFTDIAETFFKRKEQIPESDSINSTGLMFEADIFYLPENIGYTKEGLQLLYNQYEVSSFADGTISVTIPYEKLKQHLSHSMQ